MKQSAMSDDLIEYYKQNWQLSDSAFAQIVGDSNLAITSQLSDSAFAQIVGTPTLP
jgi:hypothetical protein